MFKRLRGRKRWALAAVLALVIVPGAIAGWLIYNSTASGTGAATVTATGPTNGGSVITLTPASSPAIQPGGSATDLVVNVKNNGTAAETITNVNSPTITDDATAGSGHQGLCAAHVSFNNSALSALMSHAAFAAGATTPVTLTGAISSDNGMPVYCDGGAGSGGVITFTFAAAGSTTAP